MGKHNVWMVSFVVIVFGKLSGFLKDVLMTYYFGVSSTTDAYFIAMSISSLVYMALYMTIPIVSVPLLSRVGIVEEREDLETYEGVFSVYFFLSVAFTVFTFLMSDSLVSNFAHSADSGVLSQASVFLTIMSVGFVFSTVLGFVSSKQTTEGRALPSYVVPLVNNLFFCFALILFGRVCGFEIVLWAGVISWASLIIFNRADLLDVFKLSWGEAKNAIISKSFLFKFFPAVFVFYIEQANGVVSVFFASAMAEGAVSAVGYATKLNLIVVSFFLVLLTTKFFPKISLYVASKQYTMIELYSRGVVRLVFYFFWPFLLYAACDASSIVSLAFKRGSFNEDDVSVVARVFSIVILSSPLVVIKDMINRIFFAHGQVIVPLSVSVATLVCNCILGYFLSAQFGVYGIAVSVFMSALLGVIVSALLLLKIVGFDVLREMLIGFLISTLLSIAVIALLFNASWFGFEFGLLKILGFGPFYFFLLWMIKREVFHEAVAGLRR